MFSQRMSFPRRTFLQGIGAAVAAHAFGKPSNAPNSQPNPYRLVMNWAHLPNGMTWGEVVGMDIDKDGNIYIFQRADPGILKFSPAGTLLKSWGTGLFALAHGLHIDRFGYIWTADAEAKDGKGAQVFKFDADGKLLMALGKKGVRAESPTGESFSAPTGVAVAANGDIFVSDGHGLPDPKYGNHRILKFSKDGKFIKAWGRKTGSAQGKVQDLYAIAMDSRGRLFVVDRGNKRVQLFDQEGNFIAAWPQFGVCEAIYIAKGDVLYVADANSTSGLPARAGSRPSVASSPSPYRKGIRVASAKDGSVKYFIPEELPGDDPAQRDIKKGPVGVCADSKGTIYVADVGMLVGFDNMMKKYVKG